MSSALSPTFAPDVNPVPYTPPRPSYTQPEPTGHIQLNHRLAEGIYA